MPIWCSAVSQHGLLISILVWRHVVPRRPVWLFPGSWCLILNNVLKFLLIMQRIPVVENVFCHTHKEFHRMLLSHLTVADPDSSESSRLYPSVTRHSNSIATKFLLSAPKEVFTSKIRSGNNRICRSNIYQFVLLMILSFLFR